jgi:hypothetical protein
MQHSKNFVIFIFSMLTGRATARHTASGNSGRVSPKASSGKRRANSTSKAEQICSSGSFRLMWALLTLLLVYSTVAMYWKNQVLEEKLETGGLLPLNQRLVEFLKVSGNHRMPKFIHQSWKTTDVMTHSFADGNHHNYKKFIESWPLMNPDWQYVFW